MIQEEWEENKKKIVNLVNDELYVPMKAKEIAMLIGITKKKRAALYRMLDELVEEGKIIRTESERYMKTDSSKIFEGVFSASKSGSGFVSVPGVEEDYIIKEKNSLTALNGDKVKILELPPKAGKRKQARIIEIVERGRTSAVGTFFKEGNAAFVTCDDRRFRYDILIKKSGYKGAETGQKVLVDIISYGNYYEYPEGKIVKVIGDKDEPGTDVLSVIIDQNIPYEFSKKAINEAKEKAAEDISAEISKRRDLRNVLTVTIDGEDSKDLDDAISLEKEEDGFCLGVHIADVSHYVKEKSTLDKEALERGTSVYLTDRVIPMLPKALSNGICSLNEGEDRLTLSVIMHLDKKGNVVSHEICESVINSDRRMTYGSVKKILVDKDKEEIKKYKELVPT
ncbi:MAG: RNB domain-containing ribonuclease, partial [Lachnospiraceae bacterium]|nr:RNB domain-containing ribonuclease [Lachnospiraceae bacterium]